MKLGLFSFFTAMVLTTFCSFSAGLDPNAIIAVHNRWREDVGIAEKLSYSPALARKAQAWADSLKRNKNCQMQHSKSDGTYGENLFWTSARQFSEGNKNLQKVSPEQVVNSWASEKVNFDYVNSRCRPGKVCGHYTQIIWRDTKLVGCGMAACDDTQEQIWVCQYQPAGNWVGRKPY